MDTNLDASPVPEKAEKNSDGKSEKLSLIFLGICIAALITILVMRPF